MFKKLVFYFLSYIFLIYSSFSHAEDLSCDLRGLSDCQNCVSSLSVNCGSGFGGNIANDEKPKSIVVAVMDLKTGRVKKVELKKPPRGIKYYYSDGAADSWIADRLRDQGIVLTLNTNVSVTSATFPETLKLYSDNNKSGPKTKTQAVTKPKHKYSCLYKYAPMLVSSSKCKETLCTSIGECWENDGYVGVMSLNCRAIGKACPSASACAADADVTQSTAKQVDRESFESELRQRSVQ